MATWYFDQKELVLDISTDTNMHANHSLCDRTDINHKVMVCISLKIQVICYLKLCKKKTTAQTYNTTCSFMNETKRFLKRGRLQKGGYLLFQFLYCPKFIHISTSQLQSFSSYHSKFSPLNISVVPSFIVVKVCKSSGRFFCFWRCFLLGWKPLLN